MNSIDIIGAIGVGIILLAYFLNIFSWIKKEGVLFYLMNIFVPELPVLLLTLSIIFRL